MNPSAREQLALEKVRAWLDLPLSERLARKQRYLWRLESRDEWLLRCDTCGSRIVYAQRIRFGSDGGHIT